MHLTTPSQGFNILLLFLLPGIPLPFDSAEVTCDKHIAKSVPD